MLRLNFARHFVAVCEAAIAHADRKPASDVRSAATIAAALVDQMPPQLDVANDNNDVDIEPSDFDDVDEMLHDCKDNGDGAAGAGAGAAGAAGAPARATMADDDDDDDEKIDDTDPATVDRRRHASLRRYAEFLHDRLMAEKA